MQYTYNEGNLGVENVIKADSVVKKETKPYNKNKKSSFSNRIQ